MSHQIRLRAAWERKVGSETERIDLPDHRSAKVVTYLRSFNYPTSIDHSTPLRFVAEAWIGRLSLYLDQGVLVNDLPFQDQPLEVDLSGMIAGFHQLTITIIADKESTNDQAARLIGPCYLLID